MQARAAEEMHALMLWAEAWRYCQDTGERLSITFGNPPKEGGQDRRRVVEAGGCAVWATVTLAHNLGHSLTSLVKAMRVASRAMVSGRAARRVRAELGIVAQIRVFECTCGDVSGWHPHYHFVFFLNREWEGPASPDAVRKAFLPLWDLWQRAVEAEGFTATPEVPDPKTGQMVAAGFDAQLIDLSSPEAIARMIDYADKGLTTWRTKLASGATSAELADKIAGELNGGWWKRGRAPKAQGNRHRSAAQIMEDAAIDREEADRRLVVEFKRTMTDLRVAARETTNGFRGAMVELAEKLAQVGRAIPGALWEPEKTDQEHAEAEVPEATTIGHLNAGAWSQWAAYDYPTLRAVGRQGGREAVERYLSRVQPPRALPELHPDERPEVAPAKAAAWVPLVFVPVEEEAARVEAAVVQAGEVPELAPMDRVRRYSAGSRAVEERAPRAPRVATSAGVGERLVEMTPVQRVSALEQWRANGRRGPVPF
jgi:hypothetical protein